MSQTELQCGQQQAQAALQGWCLAPPFQTPIQRTCLRRGQQTATIAAWTHGACSPPAYSPSGAARRQLREEPVSMQGSTVCKELSDRLGLSAAKEGREELRTQSRAGNTKQDSVIPRQSSTGPLPSLGSCLGNQLLQGLSFSKTCTELSFCWAGGASRCGHDRQAEGGEGVEG